VKVLILGAGGHGQVVADVLLCAHRAGSAVLPIGYLDDAVRLQGQTILGLPVRGTFEQIDAVSHEGVILAIGDNHIRERIYEQLRQRGECLVSAVHPRSIVATDVSVGPGTVICAGAVVNPGSEIGANTILNTACTVDHHNCIGDHVHVAPGVHLGGDVVIGTGALVGIGAVVMPQHQIGDWATVGAGAVVTKNVPVGTVWVGVPARMRGEQRE
jgi:sugar O-acyltransferase (sialic acid O-acetyltransferase NeuD family)